MGMETGEEVNGDDLSANNKTLNKKIVKTLYTALVAGDTNRVSKLVAPSNAELDWRFHGPPHCQYMMQMLTGGGHQCKSGDQKFRFKPRRIAAFRDRVIVEGWDGLDAYWVHIWTLKSGGSCPIMTEFREYFNTWVTVLAQVHGQEIRAWQSEPRLRRNRSLPDIVLAV